MQLIAVYVETGKSRTIAAAIDWPGWCRSGKDESSALQALSNYAVRYSKIIAKTGIDFYPPQVERAFDIVERLKGNASTDFGAPSITPAADRELVGADSIGKFKRILQASWQTFDESVLQAEGRELSLGPRGGGRDLYQIIQHVVEADLAYLKRIGAKQTQTGDKNSAEELDLIRQTTLMMLDLALKEGLPEHGPRGGVIWPIRYFVRRVAWHVLDHAWEIEDRII